MTADAAPPAAPRRFRTAAVLVGLLVALLVAEVGVRVAGVDPERVRGKRWLIDARDGNHRYHCYPSNPRGDFAPAPDVSRGGWKLFDLRQPPQERPIEELSETPYTIEYRFNSMQMRDREYADTPPAGALRIACVGDSFTQGEGVPADDVFPRRLDRALGDGYEVVNAGDSGADAALGMEKTVWLARHFGCRRILLVLIPNDVKLTPALDARQGYINDLVNVREDYRAEYESGRWYAGHLRTLHLLGAAIDMSRIRRETTSWYLDCWSREHNAANLDELGAGLARLSRLPDTEIGVVIFPLMDGLGSDYPLQPVHDTLRKLAEGAGLRTLDLAPAFAGHDVDDLRVHAVDHHPNAEAHRIAAEAIASWLRNDWPAFLER